MDDQTAIDLEAVAAEIPEMGGRMIGQFLRRLARDAPPGTAIIELGTWLGAGTAQLALGLRSRQDDHGITIHSYDNFTVSESGAEKATRKGRPVAVGDDVFDMVQDTLSPFGNVILHKGQIQDAAWDGPPISVFVDDATKYEQNFFGCMKRFGPSWIPGTTVIVFMDYYLFRKKHGISPNRVAALRGQYDFIQRNLGSFSQLNINSEYNTAAAFLYIAPLNFETIGPPPKSAVVKTAKTKRPLYARILPFLSRRTTSVPPEIRTLLQNQAETTERLARIEHGMAAITELLRGKS